MGRWTLDSITGNTSSLNGETIGHNVNVTYKLRYEPSTFGKFQELPILEWNEQIFMIEHHSKEWWEFSTNMYQHNPLSKTLEVWAKRYYVAYDTAKGSPFMGKGGVKLLTKGGQPVLGGSLSTANSEAEKADVVRKYLQKNGGRLEITIHDIPSINKPDDQTHKERLLVFNCGFAGGGPRYRGTQYLDMDGAVSPTKWTTVFQASSSSVTQTFQNNTSGMRKVSAPALVSNPRPAYFSSGECW